jgi:hypothetical protein
MIWQYESLRVALWREAGSASFDPYPYCERPIMFESVNDCREHCTLSGSIGHSAGLLENCVLVGFSRLCMVSHIMSLVIGSVKQTRYWMPIGLLALLAAVKMKSNGDRDACQSLRGSGRKVLPN